MWSGGCVNGVRRAWVKGRGTGDRQEKGEILIVYVNDGLLKLQILSTWAIGYVLDINYRPRGESCGLRFYTVPEKTIHYFKATFSIYLLV